MIDFRHGPALDSLDAIAATGECDFDFAYVDADKPNYSNYVDRLEKLLRPGGFIMLDNTLWRGAVADNHLREIDPATKALFEVVDSALKNPAFEVHSLAIADGFTILRKSNN